jgi:hypothetical protein
MGVTAGAVLLLRGAISYRFRAWAKSSILKFAEIQARDIDLARARKVAEESAAFVDEHMPMAESYLDRFPLMRVSLQNVDPGMKGIYCEFGVGSGRTINFIASIVPGEIHGFDSFEGLPEDWRAEFPKGAFRMAGLPRVAANVKLHKGWFKETLPEFVKEHPQPVAFAHFDADLYSSTKTVLEIIGPQIVEGTVLQFDEFFNYPGWKQGEYQAFREFCEARKVHVKYIGYAGNQQQVAVKVVGIAPIPSRP